MKKRRVVALFLGMLGWSMLWPPLPCGVAAAQDQRQRQMEERHKRCVDACRKPQVRPGGGEDAWKKEIKDDARYDNCVHHCDRDLVQGFPKRKK